MTWLNASGQPVAMKPMTIQIDVPSEQAVTVGTPNWPGVLLAGWRLLIAMMTNNDVAIAAAFQALIKAFMGG